MTGIRRALLGALLALVASAASAEVLTLVSGDRITGKILSETKQTVRLRTPYGRLTVPRKAIATITRADGTVETVSASPGLPSSPAGRRAKLILVVTGNTFWQAWDPKEGADPGLRFEVRLDEEPLAAYLDSRTDPGEIRGAVVNAFAYDAESAKVETATLVSAAPPEVRPGRVVLRLDVRGATGEERRLRVAYQRNEGTAEDPSWRDLASAEAPVTLELDATTLVEVRQGRGEMEFSGFPRRKMKNIETFSLEMGTGAALDTPPDGS